MTLVSRIVLLNLCAAALALSGCATKYELKPPASQDAMLVVGNLDMSEASSTLSRVDVERLSPDPETIKNKFKTNWKKDSYTFFSEQLPPGQYRFLGFGGWMGNIGMWYDLKGDPRFTRTLQKSRINFIGSYKIIKHMPPGRIGRITYEIVQVKEPGEREALLRLQEWEMDPYWKAMVDKRLKELSR